MPPITLNDTEFQPALRETPFAEFSAEEELQQMIGLKQLKEDIQEARMMSLFLKERRELNLDLCGDSRYHMLFLGKSRNRKTTVARTGRENVSSDGTIVERAYSRNLPYEPGR